jgi:acyl-CoA thioester hydrolase
MLGRECDHSLMVCLRRCAIQRRPRLKADERAIAAAQIDEFLNARTAGAASDQHMIQTPARAQGFANRMNACENVHESRLRAFAARYWKFMSEFPEVFELAIAVEPADIDQLGHVNNVTYVRWVQDAAVAHWTSAAPAADQAQLFWVVVRHEVDYKRPAMLGDRVIARTWVGTASRIRFERHTEIVRAGDGRVLAKALTIWCPMDARTGKPAAVSAELRARFSVESGK